MSRYYALVLVPGETPKEETCDAALELLYPYMRDDQEPTKDFKFDYMLGPAEIAALGADTRNVWPASEILENLAELEVEALLTPDGAWHEPEPGQLWYDEAWLERVRRLLQQHRGALALRHVLHI